MQNTLAENKFELTELANKLFMYTDAQQWDLLLREVFAPDVMFDMSSAGAGEPGMMAASAICKMWEEGFQGLDAVHHQAGHYIINLTGNAAIAHIHAYAVATHYKKSTLKGHTRTFVGSYDLQAGITKEGWRLTAFKYNLKYIDGNVALQ